MSVAADWFMLMLERMARALGAALGKFLGLRQEGRLEEANEFIKQYLQSEFDLNITELEEIKNEEVLNYLKQKNIHHSLFEIFAKIFFELSSLKKDVNEQKNLLIKSVNLLNYLSENDKTYSMERQALIKKINLQLSQYTK